MNNLIGAKMEKAKRKLRDIIKDARRLTLCVDGWSRRGVTACYYHPPGRQVYHVLPNLHRMEQPRTGEPIARSIDETLEAWGIREDKVLLIVTDHGATIVEAA